MNDYTIYIVAGIATSQNFFTNLIDALNLQYTESSQRIEIRTIYPYGDWTSRIPSQVNKVLMDYQRAEHSYRAQETRRHIIEHYHSGQIIIIGHSAGGMVGYHTAHLLESMDRLHVSKIIQIGSPKVRIRRDDLEKVAYLKASAKVDFVTRLGSWGGLSKEGARLPYLDRYKYAPHHRWDIDLVGGHPDYFRNHEPFIDANGVSNLTKTMTVLGNWLQKSIKL